MDVLDLSCTSVVAKISSFAITLQAAPEAAALESYVWRWFYGHYAGDMPLQQQCLILKQLFKIRQEST